MRSFSVDVFLLLVMSVGAICEREVEGLVKVDLARQSPLRKAREEAGWALPRKATDPANARPERQRAVRPPRGTRRAYDLSRSEGEQLRPGAEDPIRQPQPPATRDDCPLDQRA